jgi:uncharacterized protein YecE (DUF72 family)
LWRAKLTRAPLTTDRSEAIASSSRTKPWSRTGIVPSGITSGVTATEASVTALYVGTSGWSYPSWRPDFYPAGTKPGEFLRYYAERFPTVELNTTGYRLPAEEQFLRWAEQTPPGFRFAPKMNGHRRFDAATFAERVALLGDRLGPIRVLVGSALDEGLLTLVLGSFDPSVRLAFDFRHDSWAGVETELPENAVRVGSLDGAARFRYLRLREPPYDEAALESWAGRLRPLLADGLEVYCYFKHEDEPTAPAYAQRLLELVSERSQ